MIEDLTFLDKIIKTLQGGKGNFGIEPMLKEAFKEEYGNIDFVLVIPVDGIDEQ